MTDEVHAEVAARAVAAARMVGLHVCRVDVVCETVGRPLEKQSGGVVEVNAAPGLRMHLAPSFGKPRPVGEAIIERLYPAGTDGRIPVVAVTGTNGKTTVTRLIAHLFAAAGLKVGMTNTDGVWVDGQQIDSGDCSGPKSARNVLAHPDTEAAVLETARGGMLREGLGFDRCQVGVVTNTPIASLPNRRRNGAGVPADCLVTDMPTLHLGFLASHGGSNMQAIIDDCKQGRLDPTPCVVISNNSGSTALRRAQTEGIPGYHVSGETHPGAEEDREILRTCDSMEWIRSFLPAI